ncbi:MAG: YdeI/OmpD-associated family protein [Bacteriovoracia bacterium]
MKKRKAVGPLHKGPADLLKAITSNPQSKKTWKEITPLARNEWICWVTSAKKSETRKKRVDRARKDLSGGKRRPCCWPGCPHRRPSAKKWF